MTKVLIVDDEMPIRLICRVNLEAAGMDVKEAWDGPTALALARGDGKPDVILLDLMLPGLDGFRVADELLADARTSAIPILFLSARADLGDQARAIELGGIDYITKPFDPRELAQRIQSLLQRVEAGERDELQRAKLDALSQLFE
jgi:two-component system, OmpR family, alkaline phosphatase synthesis response regulator PhoP